MAVMPVPTSVVPNPSHTVLSPLQSQAELVGAPIAYHQGRPQHRATDVMTFHVASPSPQRVSFTCTTFCDLVPPLVRHSGVTEKTFSCGCFLNVALRWD